MPRLPGTVLVAQTCRRCGVLKDADQFHRDKNSRLGRVRQCNECRIPQIRKWQAKKPRMVLSYAKAYNSALQQLRERHPEEFKELLDLELDR